MEIIYWEKVVETQPNQLTSDMLKETFTKAIEINHKLLSNHKKVAYFFIDPLINHFEAANNFYFNIFECESVSRINTYKSGASPIQALSDAKELIDNNLYDAVFIFGQEFLLSDLKKYNKDQIKQAMNFFEDKSLIECYNLIGHHLCRELGLSKEDFYQIADLLYTNYIKAYNEITGSNSCFERGRLLEDLNADLFRLTDCANPNVDFAGGIIVANSDTAQLLHIPKEENIKVMSVKYTMVKGLPENIDNIVGNKDHIFPHLKEAFVAAQNESKLDIRKEFLNRNLLLEVYTCYPPIPMAFLLTTKIANDIAGLKNLLNDYQITVSGGLNLARAPWNNPALNGLIDTCKKMNQQARRYGLVHGNGGIGEIQGVAILEAHL